MNFLNFVKDQEFVAVPGQLGSKGSIQRIKILWIIDQGKSEIFEVKIKNVFRRVTFFSN